MHSNSIRGLIGAALLSSCGLVLTACGGGDEPTFKPLALNIAHINDHHSQLDAFAATELTLDDIADQIDHQANIERRKQHPAWFQLVENPKLLDYTT